VVAGALALGGCRAAQPTGSIPSSITNGSDDGGDPAVVALVGGSNSLRCTGALITPRVVLTAAHCQIGAGTFHDFSAFFGADTGGGGVTQALVDAVIDPDYDPTTQANDFALLFLDADAAAAPLPWASQPLADASLAGATVRLVGFGQSSASSADTGVKRAGTAMVTDVSASELRLAPAPSQPCEGDSGGPALVSAGGVELVAGVSSRGDAGCMQYSVEARVDAVAARFIQPYLDRTAPGAAMFRDRCLYPEHCGGGPCIAALDDAQFSYCSRACAHDGDCPGDMSCTQSLCQFRAPSPGALGAACGGDGDCVDGSCVTTAAGARVCSVHCVPGDATCPSEFACASIAGAQFYCVANAAPSGCAAGGDGSAGGWLVIAALFMATIARSACRCWARRRRSR